MLDAAKKNPRHQEQVEKILTSLADNLTEIT